MPGVFIFRMAAGIVALPEATATAVPALVEAITMDGLTASWIVVSLTLGVVVPKYIYDACLREPDRKRVASNAMFPKG